MSNKNFANQDMYVGIHDPKFYRSTTQLDPRALVKNGNKVGVWVLLYSMKRKEADR